MPNDIDVVYGSDHLCDSFEGHPSLAFQPSVFRLVPTDHVLSMLQCVCYVNSRVVDPAKALILIFGLWVENNIRPFVVGRKAWLFSDTPDGAHISATIYSLVESAKANGLAPYDYLYYIMREITSCKEPTDYMRPLPNVLTPEKIAIFHERLPLTKCVNIADFALVRGVKTLLLLRSCIQFFFLDS